MDRVLVVGEALFDLVPVEPAPAPAPGGALSFRALPGGGPANTAVGLARLGVPTSFAGRLSVSSMGRERRRALAAEGIDLSPTVTAAEPVTLTTVSLDDQGVATYNLYGPETADWAWRVGDLPDPARLDIAAVHAGSLAAVMPPGADLLSAWLAEIRRHSNALVSYDPNFRPSIVPDMELCRDAFGSFLPSAHLVKVSTDDVAALEPKALEPGGSTENVVQGWLTKDPGPDLVLLTKGAAGSVAMHRDGRRLERPAPAVKLVDTVGAGDAFVAGFLASLRSSGVLSPAGLADISDTALAGALELANRVAAITCARHGADPPRVSEL